MRLRLILSVIALLAVALPAAEAERRGSRARDYDEEWSGRQSKRQRADADSFTSGRRSDSKDDIDARAADPGGDYAAFPSWARKALGGNKPLGR